MPKIYEADGYAVIVWTNESRHRLPHVHVIRGGACQAIALGGPGEPPSLLSRSGMKPQDAHRALEIVWEHQEEFLARWEAIHE